MPTTPNFSQPAIFSEVATPTVPDSGYLKVYAKSGTLYSIANGGTEKSYVAISGSGLPIGAYTLPTTDGTASQVLQTNGSGTVTWQTVSGGGITSINGDTTAAQLLTVGTSGTNFTIDSTTTPGTSVFNIPDASDTARGLITTGYQLIAGDKDFMGSISATNLSGTNTGDQDLSGYLTIYDASTTYLTTYDASTTYLSQSTLSGITLNGIPIVDNATFSSVAILNGVEVTDFTIESYDNTHYFRMPDASATARGLITTGAQTIAGAKTFSSSITTSSDINLSSSAVAAADISLVRDAAGILAQRSSTTAQTFRLYNTYTSSTSYETLNLKGKDSANFEIGPENGSAGGTLRGLTIGGYAAGTTTIAPWLSFTDTGNAVLTNTVSTSGSPTALTLTGAAHTTLALSTEATDVNFNLARTVQFATGALTTQRAVRIQAPTYGFVGASTITTASTLSISGAPVAGTNATITNKWALNVESGLANFADRVYCAGVHTSSYIVDNSGASNWYIGYSGASTLSLKHDRSIGWCPGNGGGTSDVELVRDAASCLGLRVGTTAQSLGVYGTRTSTTSYERVNIRGKASANFEIGPENGSAGGTLRGLTLGGYSAGSSTITPWLSFTSSGTPTFNLGTVVIPSGGTGLVCQQTNIYLDSYGTHSGIRYRRSEGTQGTPLAVANNSLLGFFATYGYHGAGYHSTQGCTISFYATEAFTSGAQGSKIVFGTTPNGTTTNTVALTIDQNQVATFSKLVAQSAAEITSTPSGTTQTITLNNGNHQTLTLTSSTGAVTATLTVPSNVSSGTIIVKQHGTTPRNITWAVSAGTIKWMGTQPTWSSDAANDIRIVSWRYDGSVMYLMSTDKAA